MTTKTLPKDLREFQAMLEKIFGEHDARYYSKKQVLLRMFGLIALLGKTIRRSKGKAGREALYLSRLFRWFVSLCNFMHLDLAKALWQKYPGVCPHCQAMADCSCEDELRAVVEHTLPYYRQTGERPRTIKAWQQMFGRIYGRANRSRVDPYVFAVFRLLEEVGEVSEELVEGLTDFGAFKLEVADIGARIFALANLLDIDLEDELLRRYSGVCPNCKEETCTCPKRRLD
jgi:NTP pyrophosphatase (non-canonical NTP hydrolase)